MTERFGQWRSHVAALEVADAAHSRLSTQSGYGETAPADQIESRGPPPQQGVPRPEGMRRRRQGKRKRILMAAVAAVAPVAAGWFG